MKVYISWSTSSILLLIFLTLVHLTSNKVMNKVEKWTQFECGFNLMDNPQITFSFQFFMVAMLFLIFDVEISLVLSYPMEIMFIKNYLNILLFLALLYFGLIYEWQKGKIDWTK